MLSYPNMGGASKELQHPSLVTLAKLAEKAGLDLRILVLTRDARDLLASTTEHRGFGEVNKQVEQLAKKIVNHVELGCLEMYRVVRLLKALV